MKHWDKRQILSLLFIGTIITSTLGVLILMNYANTKQATTFTQASSSLDKNCKEGVYWAKSQKDGSTIKCGRAPDCGGYSYDSVNGGIGWQNAGVCWFHEKLGVSKCDTTCKGYVPLCCYKIEETGDPTACTWPERGYCHPQQCESAKGKLCGGGDCRCGVPIVAHCKQDGCITSSSQIPYIPLSVRLNGGAIPTATPTSVPATATPRPTTPPIATATPIQPTMTRPTPTTVTTTVPTSGPTSTQPTQQQNQPIPTFTPTSVPPSGNNPENFPTSIPPTETPLNPTSQPFPTIEIKSPKQLAREVITYERIDTINKATEKPLTAVKTGVLTIKSYDSMLETMVQEWIFTIRIKVQKLFR